jgi:hypothetical protein
MDNDCKVGFVYTPTQIGADGQIISQQEVGNLMPAEMIAYMLNACFKGGSQNTTFYISLFENNYTPQASDTMTTFIAACGENTTYTTSGTNRLTLTLPSPVAGSITTSSAPNEFDFTGAATIRGAFITTGLTRGGTTGLLVSAALFASPFTLANLGTLRVPVGFALVSA